MFVYCCLSAVVLAALFPNTSLQLTLLTNQDMTHTQLWRYYVYELKSLNWHATVVGTGTNIHTVGCNVFLPELGFHEEKSWVTKQAHRSRCTENPNRSNLVYIHVGAKMTQGDLKLWNRDLSYLNFFDSYFVWTGKKTLVFFPIDNSDRSGSAFISIFCFCRYQTI